MGHVFNPTPRQLGAMKAALFALCLLPLLRLVWGAWNDELGANPIEFVTRSLGSWTLNFLLITLTVTPLRKATGWVWLTRLRRMLGLFVFFYVVLHLSSYLWLDQFFEWTAIGKDILKRPFITVGMAAFMLLVPLAATSNNATIRHLGGHRWQALHRSIYLIGILAVTHYWWLVKKDVVLPGIYAAILGLLLGMRIFWRYQQALKKRAGEVEPKPLGRAIPIVLKR
jgi:sulfoxide reductase heme-binding subunit YedZ